MTLSFYVRYNCMRFDRFGNFKSGVKWGIIYRIVSILSPFLIQMLMIRSLGSGYVGVKSLFSSIISIISLSELGIGNAIVFCMYEPLTNNDTDTICNLLELFRSAYLKIACFILGIGLLLIPIIDFVIKGDVPKGLNIYIVYILILFNSAVSYLGGAYRSSILIALQRVDLISICGIVIDTLNATIQLYVLYAYKNYYIFLIIMIGNTFLKNVVISIISKKKYPMYVCKGKVSNELYQKVKEKVKGSFIGNVCGVTRNTFDNIFISAFVGLTAVTVYGSYYYVLTSISGFIAVLLSTLVPIIGNCVIEKSKEDVFDYMININNLYMILTCWITACMILFYQSFIKMWIGEELVLDYGTMILFPIYFYIGKMGDVRGVFSDAAGLFWENRWRTIIEAVSNIILNYILAKIFGLWGIVIATIITLFFVGFIGSTIVIFKYFFHSGIKEYFLSQFKILIFMIVVGAICMYANFYLDNFNMMYEIVIKIVIAIIVIPIICFCGILIDKSLLNSFNWMKKIVCKKS